MKIIVTEIEANSEELRASNTLGDNLSRMLSRCFERATQRYEPEESEDDNHTGEV